MKHPNKNVEAWNILRVRANKASCFLYWTSDKFIHGLDKNSELTEDALLNALIAIRKDGKTIPVELADL